MTKADFHELNVGDMITHDNDSHTYIVTGNYGGRVTAIQTVDTTNPTEWALRYKATYTMEVRNE